MTLALTAVVLAALVAPQAAAAAPSDVAAGPDVVRCSELGGSVVGRTHVGDLVADVPCRLSRAAVTGDVTVGPGATLGLDHASVKGDVRSTGRVSLFASTVYGGVVLTGGSLLLEDGTVRHSVRGTGGTVDAYWSRIGGAVHVRTSGAVTLWNAEVGGWVTAASSSVMVRRSTLLRGLTTTPAGAPSATATTEVCGSRIAADVTVSGAAAQISDEPWDHSLCNGSDTPNAIGGSLRLLGNPGTVHLSTTVVAGDLECSGNTGMLVVRESVRVTGVRTGQCATS